MNFFLKYTYGSSILSNFKKYRALLDQQIERIGIEKIISNVYENLEIFCKCYDFESESIIDSITEMSDSIQETVENVSAALCSVFGDSIPCFEMTKKTNKMDALDIKLKPNITSLTSVMFIIICDDATFTANTLNNYLWVAYTRCNPSHDIYGIDSFTSNKHWGCNGPLIIDARIKPHHAPTVEKDPATEKKIDRLFEKGASLYQIMK